MREPNGWPLEIVITIDEHGHVSGRRVRNVVRHVFCGVRWIMHWLTLGRYMRRKMQIGVDVADGPFEEAAADEGLI